MLNLFIDIYDNNIDMVFVIDILLYVILMENLLIPNVIKMNVYVLNLIHLLVNFYGRLMVINIFYYFISINLLYNYDKIYIILVFF